MPSAIKFADGVEGDNATPRAAASALEEAEPPERERASIGAGPGARGTCERGFEWSITEGPAEDHGVFSLITNSYVCLGWWKSAAATREKEGLMRCPYGKAIERQGDGRLEAKCYECVSKRTILPGAGGLEDIAEGGEEGEPSGAEAGHACDRSIAQRLVDLHAAESSSGSSNGHIERIMAGVDGYGGGDSDGGSGGSEAGSRHWAASTTNNAEDDAIFAALKPPDGTLRQARFAMYSAGINQRCETMNTIAGSAARLEEITDEALVR